MKKILVLDTVELEDDLRWKILSEFDQYQLSQVKEIDNLFIDLKKENFDIICFNRRTPWMDGFQLAHRIRLITKEPRLMMFTDCGDEQDQQRCQQEAIEYYSRDISGTDLIKAVEEVIE